MHTEMYCIRSSPVLGWKESPTIRRPLATQQDPGRPSSGRTLPSHMNCQGEGQMAFIIDYGKQEHYTDYTGPTKT